MNLSPDDTIFSDITSSPLPGCSRAGRRYCPGLYLPPCSTRQCPAPTMRCPPTCTRSLVFFLLPTLMYFRTLLRTCWTNPKFSTLLSCPCASRTNHASTAKSHSTLDGAPRCFPTTSVSSTSLEEPSSLHFGSLLYELEKGPKAFLYLLFPSCTSRQCCRWEATPSDIPLAPLPQPGE